MKKTFKKAELKIERIIDIIKTNQNKVEKGIVLMNFLIGERINKKWLKTVHQNDKKYYIDANSCTACGICIKICPVNNISMINSAIRFNHKCEECRACIHNCPQEAIKIKQKNFLKKRYVHPEISVTDIINQK